MGSWQLLESPPGLGGCQIKKKGENLMETGFNKKVCRELGEKVETALNEALKGSGFEMRRGGGKFTEVEFTMKMVFSLTDGETQAHKDYREWAELAYTPFPPDMLDATFNYGSLGEITVIGWLPNRRKNDILFVNSKGEERIGPSEDVIFWYTRKFGKYINPNEEARMAQEVANPPEEMEVTFTGK